MQTRRILIITVILATAGTSLFAQEVPAPTINLKAPKGWSGETISLPPGFAKDMSWKGVEVIRFAPGMFKQESDTFFTYAFVFWLPEVKTLDAQDVEREMLRYYRGLAKAVSRGNKLAVDPSEFTLDVKAVKDSTNTWNATLHWAEPFVTREKQTLHFRLTLNPANGSDASVLAVAVSPASAESDIWKDLNRVLMTFEIKHADK